MSKATLGGGIRAVDRGFRRGLGSRISGVRTASASAVPGIAMRICALIAAMTLAAPAFAGDRENIVGSWKLMSVVLHIESPPMPHPNVNDRTVRVIVSWRRDRP
jgi:hypothetical protein